MKQSIGSPFDEFLAQDGTFDDTTSLAHKRVLAWQLEEAMKDQRITQQEMAKRMKPSRTAIHRLLDPNNASITLSTIDRAINALGLQLTIGISGLR